MQALTDQQLTVLRRLDNVLEEATAVGALDQFPAQCDSPNSINDVRDALLEMLKPKFKPKFKIDGNSTVPIDTLLDIARDLISEGENIEYDRALAELILSAAGEMIHNTDGMLDLIRNG